ncbi:MAG: hypothetical protein ACK4N5_06245 [Myxococcales bacterium]
MTLKNLAVACMSATLALCLVGCGGPDDPQGGTDAGQTGGPDAGRPDSGNQPPPPQCDPPCPSGKTCDTSTGVPECVFICNAPNGCQPDTEVCNETTKACEPVSCNGSKCQQGQACVNLTTGRIGENIAGGVCTCVGYKVNSNGQEVADSDTCGPYGKVCDTDSDGPAEGEPWTANATCKLPGEKQECIPTVGCEAGLQCETLQGGGGTFSMCLRKCATTADCPSLLDKCEPNLGGFCFYNYCARPATGTGQDRAQYFKPCNSTGTNDGTCVPLSGQTDTIGICFQNGTVAAGGECDPAANRQAPDKLCGANELCFGVMPDAADATKTRGICRPLCNAAPTGTANPVQACSTGSCLSITNLNSNLTRLGACFANCDPVGTPGQSGCQNDILGNTTGCRAYDFTDPTKGYCVALSPTAGATAGSNCAAEVKGDARMTCGDRLICLTNGKCHGWCNQNTCASATADCSTCDPSQPKCTPLGQGVPATFKVGICQ